MIMTFAIAGVRISHPMRFGAFCFGILSLVNSYSHAQDVAPKARGDDETEKRHAASLVNSLRARLPAENPKKLIDALNTWRTMAEYLRSYSGAQRISSLLNHKDPDVRREAAMILAEINRPSDYASTTIERLMIMLNDRDVDVRTGAFFGLARMAPLGKVAITKALEALKDDDPRIRRAAYQVISHQITYDKDLVPYVINALDDPDIGPWNDKPGTNSVSGIAMFDLRLKVKTAGKEGLPKLQRIVKSKMGDDFYRSLASSALAAVAPDDPFVINLARTWLKGEHPREMSQGAVLVSQLGAHGKAAVPELIAVLQLKPLSDMKSDENLKRHVIEALRSIGPTAKESIPVLRGLLSVEDIVFRMYVADAIKRIEAK